MNFAPIKNNKKIFAKNNEVLFSTAWSVDHVQLRQLLLNKLHLIMNNNIVKHIYWAVIDYKNVYGYRKCKR